MPLTPHKHDKIHIKHTNPYKTYNLPNTPKYEKETQLRIYFHCESNHYTKHMKANIWYSQDTNEWRWTLSCDENLKIQESGGQTELRDAMNDIANTIEYLATTRLPE